MKRLLTLGAALTALLLATALIGAVSASATVLCKENTATCAAESIYPSGTSVSGSIEGTFKLEGGITMECGTSSLSGKTTAEKGAPLPLSLESMPVSGCTTGCKTAAVSNLPYTAGVDRTTGGDGTVKLSSGGTGAPVLKLTGCTLFSVNCTYSIPDPTLKGGNPATLSFNDEAYKQEGSSGLCAKEELLKANYGISTPKPLYVRAGAGVGETVVCKEQATVCPVAATYASGTSISAEGTYVHFAGAWGTTTCKESGMSVKTSAEHGTPLGAEITSMTFASCSGECAKIQVATPREATIAATSGGNGTMKSTLAFVMSECVFGGTCYYGSSSAAEFSVSGGTEAVKPHLDLKPVHLYRELGSNGNCGAELEVDLDHAVTSPLPLWVAKREA